MPAGRRAFIFLNLFFMTRAKSSNNTPMRGFEIDDDDTGTLQRAEQLGWKLADVWATRW